MNSYVSLYWLAGDVKEPTHFSQRVVNIATAVVVWSCYYSYRPHLTSFSSFKLGQQV